ncbi:MAG: nucleotidyl transferase AbiEii/AbiGii toxin family protein [Streptococcaceae bacterium]|nr:nucleotidyl transferase AbiEii/AbiGii toxin family protein [Streptococcaceae bacterium]
MKKLSESKNLREKFILKGGYLLTTLLQLENRATADLDGTIANMKLDDEAVDKFKQLITSPDDDGIVRFEWLGAAETRVNFLYSGFNLRLNYLSGKMRVPINVDMTTGEDILPAKLQPVSLLFEEGTVEFRTYPIEQILADKIYTTLVYGKVDDSNSRAKDLYDIHIIQRNFPEFSLSDVANAISMTNHQRAAAIEVTNYIPIIDFLSKSDKQKEYWSKFQHQNSYARSFSFEEIFDSVRKVVNDLSLFNRK